MKGIWADWRRAGMRDSQLARLCVQMGTNVHEWAMSLCGAQQNSVEGSHGMVCIMQGRTGQKTGRCHVSCLLPLQG